MSELNDLCKVARELIISDSEMRSKVLQEMRDLIIPALSAFMDTNESLIQSLGLGSRFSVSEVESLLSSALFEG